MYWNSRLPGKGNQW